MRVQEVRHQTVEDFRPLEINRMPGLGDRFEFGSANKIREGHRGSRRDTIVRYWPVMIGNSEVWQKSR